MKSNKKEDIALWSSIANDVESEKEILHMIFKALGHVIDSNVFSVQCLAVSPAVGGGVVQFDSH